MNPFWHLDRLLVSPLSPEECRRRLKSAPTSLYTVARTWLGRGDASFYTAGVSSFGGSILEVHVRVNVMPGDGTATKVHLCFSAGPGSALVLVLIELGCLLAFGWAVWSVATAGWSWFPTAGLLGIVVPIVLVLALRSTATRDMEELSGFIAGNVEGAARDSGVRDQ